MIILQRPYWVSERLYPFRSRFADVEGCRLHYVDEGSGPPILMLHGNPTWSFLYRDIIRGLADRFRCIAPDYPGFGLSEAATRYDFKPRSHAAVIERLLLTLDLSGVTLMAHDWGGPIGLWVAAQHPERFRGLVIANTWAWPVEGDRRFERYSQVVGGPVGKLLIGGLRTSVSAFLRGGTRRRLPREVLSAYRGPFARRSARLPVHVLAREMAASPDFLAEVQAGLRRLDHLPTLLLWGDEDPAFRESERVRIERALPRSRTVILRGAGHYIQEDAPEEIVAAVRSWAEDVEAEAAEGANPT